MINETESSDSNNEKIKNNEKLNNKTKHDVKNYTKINNDIYNNKSAVNSEKAPSPVNINISCNRLSIDHSTHSSSIDHHNRTIRNSNNFNTNIKPLSNKRGLGDASNNNDIQGVDKKVNTEFNPLLFLNKIFSYFWFFNFPLVKHFISIDNHRPSNLL